MPKFNVPDPDPAVLAAMREALRNPVKLTPEQGAEFQEFRRRACIRSVQTRHLERRGRRVWRVVGKRGEDLPVHPLVWEAAKAEQQFLRDRDGVQPHVPPDPMLGVHARQAKTAERDAPIIALYEIYKSRGPSCVQLIQRASGENESFIRRAIARIRTRP